MQFTAPLSGTNVIPEGEGPSRHPADSPSPLSQRKSLHTVRVPQPAAPPEYEPQWTDKMQLKWVPARQPEPEPAAEEQQVDSPVPRGNGFSDNGAQQAQPYDALSREIAELKQTVQLMARASEPQQPQGPQPPNPEDFDFYEPSQVKEFHRLNNEYIQATVQQSVQAAFAPHQGAMQSAEYNRQYNSVLADHGWLADGSENPHFKPLMEQAIRLVAESNGRYSIPEAYDRAELDAYRQSKLSSPHRTATQPQGYAKPGQRTLTAQEAAQKAAQAQSLPQRSGVNGAGEPPLPAGLMNVGALGRIMLHNQQTGRARPI